MSRMRVEAKDPSHYIFAGFDAACGFFVQVFSELEEDPIYDVDSTFDSRGDVIDILEQYAEDSPMRRTIIAAITADITL